MLQKKLSLIIALLSIGYSTSACANVDPQPIEFKRVTYFFDVGGSESEIKKDYFPVFPETKYSRELGYGWTTQSLNPFSHEETKESRDSFLIDGVIAESVGFRADIPEGEWMLTIWFEGGLEDTVSTKISIQNERKYLDLQAFSPHAEARTDIQKMYRVIQQKVQVGNEGISFYLEGVNDQVRLLGIGVAPIKEPENKDQEELLALIEETGSFKSKLNVEATRKKLAELSTDPENMSFVSHWDNQLGILSKAEEFFYLRGWGWATDSTDMSLFDHLHQSVMVYDGILSMNEAEQHPLYERALWYRGRLLYWLYLERGGINEKRGADRDLAELYKLFSSDDLVRMYNGEKIDQDDEFDKVPNSELAPEWASVQWELTNRLKDIVDWWVYVQQDENGEFGGKFGDDVEILRWWSPLILSGDKTTYEGWKKLADGVWNSSKIKNGYAKNPSDVEHSSEFISDTAPLMVLYNDDPVYADRLSYSSDHFQNLWTGFNENGHRFFKSAWFSSSEVETEEPKNRDVSYNARATKAVRYYAWKTNDSETKKALIEWADAWLSASESTQKEKPSGIIPPSVEYPTGIINGSEPTWYNANMYWDYFNWNGSSGILDQLLFTWTFTGDNKYLNPLMIHLNLVKEYKDELENEDNRFKKGSEAWVAYELGNSDNFWNVVENWRLLSDDNSYDGLILEHGSDLIKYRITKNEDHLVDAMIPYLETVRYNRPMLTSEVVHTDRVYIKEPSEREAGILQGMITGFGADESASPYIAVSWENAGRDITYLVTDSDSSSLKVKLYSFSDNEEELTMRLWQLSNGRYTITKKGQEGKEEQVIDISKRGERFPVKIPSHELLELEINRLQ
ncbi:MAG: hypothetical protein JJ971_12670 [Balneolaceae bacterium]|nr:hypothetical protein [Balneolaceae bacterium]MBO6547294.1 hypothetical protein [Balneolaceae bacterium]MBO6647759.1 hypothetical protein [Balneolaceae bacterium]